eukprot:1146885-Pelagomonas_calceolata.AAC.1
MSSSSSSLLFSCASTVEWDVMESAKVRGEGTYIAILCQATTRLCCPQGQLTRAQPQAACKALTIWTCLGL